MFNKFSILRFIPKISVRHYKEITIKKFPSGSAEQDDTIEYITEDGEPLILSKNLPESITDRMYGFEDHLRENEYRTLSARQFIKQPTADDSDRMQSKDHDDDTTEQPSNMLTNSHMTPEYFRLSKLLKGVFPKQKAIYPHRIQRNEIGVMEYKNVGTRSLKSYCYYGKGVRAIRIKRYT